MNKNRIPLVCLVLLLVLAAPSLTAEETSTPGVTIRHSSVVYSSKGSTLEVTLDVLGEGPKQLPPEEVTTITVSTDGTPLTPLESTLTKIKAAGEPTAILVLVETTENFVSDKFTAVDPGTGTPPIKYILEGLGNLANQVSSKDVMALYEMDEQGAAPLVPWSDRATFADALGSLSFPKKKSEPKVFPTLYYHMATAAHLLATTADLPERKVLLVITDGLDPMILKEALVPIGLQTAKTFIDAGGIELVTVGYSILYQEPLGYLAKLCAMTGGIYVDGQGVVAFDEIPEVLSKVAPLLRNQLVYEATFAPGVPLVPSKLSFELEIMVDGVSHTVEASKAR